MRWDGADFGVQLGVSNMNTDFGNNTSDLVAYSLRNTVGETNSLLSIGLRCLQHEQPTTIWPLPRL